jgi:hypothetical protein
MKLMLLLLLVSKKYHWMRLRVVSEEKGMPVEMMMMLFKLIFVVIEMSMVSHELLVVSHVWTGDHVMWAGRNVWTVGNKREKK